MLLLHVTLPQPNIYSPPVLLGLLLGLVTAFLILIKGLGMVMAVLQYKRTLVLPYLDYIMVKAPSLSKISDSL